MFKKSEIAKFQSILWNIYGLFLKSEWQNFQVIFINFEQEWL